MEKDLKKKNIIIGILLFIVLVLLILCVYFIFIKKDKINNSDTVKEERLELKQVILDSSNKEVSINNNKYNLKVVDFTLYINDKKIDNVQFEGSIYVTNKYALISIAGQCGNVINYAIDENGNVIEVYKNIVIPSYGDNLSYALNDIRIENDKLVADLPVECFCFETEDHKCNDETIKVQFTYDSKNINIKKA